MSNLNGTRLGELATEEYTETESLGVCEYGCPQEEPDQLCYNCGHPKRNHLYVHPHRCLGESSVDDVSVVRSCGCTEFRARYKTRPVVRFSTPR